MNPRYLGFGFLHFFFSAVGQTFFIGLFVAEMTERLDWEENTFAGIVLHGDPGGGLSCCR